MARAAIYCRISSDPEGRELGVRRQEEDCRALAERLGLEVGHVFVENDVGASTRSRKPRPLFAEMLERCRSGEFRAILAYSNTRLTRRPRENEDLIDLAERLGVRIKTVVSGEWDLSTADGRAVARTVAAWDGAEAERTAERVQRAVLQRAQAGRRHGATPYGWRSDDEADVLREAARRVLAGESLRSVYTDLNRRGVPTPRGKGPWASQTLRQLLLRESNAGRRTHRGGVVGPGDWPALLDEDTHDRVVALLNDPGRTTSRGSERRWLGSGLFLCGRCGSTMRVNKVKEGQQAYACASCYRTRRKVESVDAVVRAAVLEVLGTEGALDELLAGDPEALRAARSEAEGIEARLALAADQFADGAITGEQLARITARLRPKLEDARRRERDARGAPEELAEAWRGLEGVYAAWSRWDLATLEQRRALVSRLCTVTILPATPGRSFDPATVRVERRVAG